jgi:xanthine dehydrogenase molybdenum-binding subunit
MSTKEKKADDLRVVGTRPIRPDGADKVTGRARFGDDIHLSNMLHGKVLRSPHAHARIISIDTSKAEALPGVLAVVTGADFPVIEHEMVSQGEAGLADMRDIADNCMAQDKVLYDGHALAAVAAENPHVADEAVQLIEVEYELLTPLMDVRSSMAEDAPKVHEHSFPGFFIAPTEAHLPNASRVHMSSGDLEAGFAEADHIVEREFTSETYHQGYIESHITTVDWDSNGNLTVWTSTQGQFEIRDNLADVLAIPIGRIKVIPMEVGGAFGGKDRIYLDPVAALLSKKSARPVKMAMRRDEVIRATGPSPGTYIKAKMGIKADGTLVAADLHLAYEAGAYAGGPIFLGVVSSAARYNISNFQINGFDVIVNKPKTRPYRAPGAPQGLFAMEQIVDELAACVNMDPVDFRIKNLTREGDILLPGFPLAPIDTDLTLNTLKSHPHYTAPLEGPNRGRGMSYAMWFNLGAISSARLAVNPDGTVHLSTASSDMSGTRMTLAMQAAEALGIEVGEISADVSDSQSIGFSMPTVGSRTTYSTGIVVMEAATEVLKQMSERAAMLWEVDVDQISVADGVFSNKSNAEQSISFKELGSKGRDTGGPITVHQTSSPESFIPGVTAHLVDVEVDSETGKVDILRYTAVQDVGKAVHPDYVEGQIQGAAVQGIGLALNEEYFYDKEGHLKNASLLDYRMPTSLDLPMIDAVIVESPNPAHPYGVRGCGEHSIIPPASAIANAIHDAVGIRPDSMPMAPHKICAAIKRKQAASD